jgi:orotidine-5'-phosphate decarboxylase
VSASTQRAREHLAFALDVPDATEARAWISRLRGRVGVFKVGLELFVAAGPEVIASARDSGARVFLDLKLHDIPETVARAVATARRHHVDYLTVHAAGGPAMLKRAATAASDGAGAPITILAVTVLTSMDDAQVAAVGLEGGLARTAERLGGLAIDAGAGGLVCSAQEVATLRARFPKAVLVTPGIRPAGADRGDQSRVATAGDAIRAGADLLVVGRPIRDAADPIAVVETLVGEIESASV